jgi:sulfoxide reductase heme-binding subunit YedZ
MKDLKSRLIKHYFPLVLVSIIIGVIFHFVWTKKDLITLIADVSGYIAIVILSVSLLLGSINILFKRKNPVSSYFRRDISVTGGILAVIHSITGLFVHLRGNMWQYFLTKTNSVYSIRLDDFGLANYTGLISTILIILLLATSNDYSIAKLKTRNWKNIQRLTYLMFILAIVHVIYYRLNNFDLIYYFYMPMISVVLIFQAVGILLRIKSLKSVEAEKLIQKTTRIS